MAVKIGVLYILSGFGGSLMSALSPKPNVSVGASGALLGLLGSMLSELFLNWTIYANKVNNSFAYKSYSLAYEKFSNPVNSV